MKKLNFLLKSFILILALHFAPQLLAQAPNVFSYQAILRDGSSTLLLNQTVGVRVTILKTSASGTEVYKETFNTSTNNNGLLSLNVGGGTVVSGNFGNIDWSDGPYFIKSEVDPTGGTSYSLTSTSQLLSVPYALTAKTAESVSGVSGTANRIAKFSTGTSLGNSQITDDGTSIGVNAASLDENVKFLVEGSGIRNVIRGTLVGAPSTSIATSGSIYGESTTGIGTIGVSGSQNGVYGLSTGTLGGTVGVNTGSGNGLWGITTGTGIAGYFEGGANGRGIVVSTGASGFGTSTPTSRLTVMQPTTPVPAIDDNAALTAFSYSANGSKAAAVYGYYNDANYGVGVQGKGYQGTLFKDAPTTFPSFSDATDAGVYGSAATAGVIGTSQTGSGVRGFSISAHGILGYSQAGTTGGAVGVGNTIGVFGNAVTVGTATVPTTRVGIWGQASGAANNWAGYFNGNVSVIGSLAKGSGTFKIDHPLDPANKYLYHSFVESPDMMNVYNGNVSTDANGFATVKMPDYFSALNKDFRYQLTVIGTFANAIISKEINNNTFEIRTDKPNIKVSWQITGVRQDKYANAHRVIPEVEKEAQYKGKYLHAEEWGKSASESIAETIIPRDSQEAAIKKPQQNAPKPQAESKNDGIVAGVELKSAK